jgi:hypothetical protein
MGNELQFTLEDLEGNGKKLGGKVVVENGQVFIHLDGHGNSATENGEILGVQLDMGIARLVVFRDINDEAPTESMDLDGALESKRIR